MTDDRRILSTELVRSLIADQFPQWAELPITPIIPGGWNNCSFRLGETMVVRLPSAERYAAQVQKEQRFLPYLAPYLPLPIPQAIALGHKGGDYSWPFGIYSWLDGHTAERGDIDDLCRFAKDLADFLSALYTIDASSGPKPGPHNFYRGGPLAVYDNEARTAIANLEDKIDVPAVTAVWEMALSSQWDKPAVWLHGDIAAGNLLVNGGKLSAVIDFGSMGVGDPACDLAIAWTFLKGESRKHFHASLPLDLPTWQRGQGWALWKSLITLERIYLTSVEEAAEQQQILHDIIQYRFE